MAKNEKTAVAFLQMIEFTINWSPPESWQSCHVLFWLRDVFHPSLTAGGSQIRHHGTTLSHIMEGHEHRAKKILNVFGTRNPTCHITHCFSFALFPGNQYSSYHVEGRDRQQQFIPGKNPTAVLSWKKIQHHPGIFVRRGAVIR